MKTMLKLIGMLFFTILFFGCSNQEKPEKFDYGRVENSIYSNSFFNLELTIPSGWIVQTKELTENLREVGAELVAGDDRNMKAALKASDVNSVNLLMISQYEYGAEVDYNASLSLVAENLKNSPGVKTGGDYLSHARKVLKQSQFQFDYVDENFKSETINGHKFYLMNASVNFMGLEIKQLYYSTILNEFSLSLIISYVSEEQEFELKEVVNSMQFKK